MRRILLVATMASVALASCVKDESVDLTQQAKKLSFEAPVMGTQSRAYYGEIQGGDYRTEESFKVFAKQHKGALTNWETAENFWSGALEAKYDATLEYWDTDTDYYWPNSDDNVWLSFGAYSPATLTGTNAAAEYSNKGLTITDFEVSRDVAKQVDLMYSGPILNKKYTEANDIDGVDIIFKHALTSIVFSAIDSDPNAKYTITSIKVNGKFITKGTFCENLTAINASGTADWTEKSGNDAPTEYILATGLTTVVGNANTVITEKTSALLTIPHEETEMDDEATVTITYTVDPESGAADYDATKTVKLADFKISSTTSITEWNLGYRYTYQFNFGGTSKIYFKPTVAQWTDGGTATLTIQ
ncbi:MAG: fimbrillin family protein [Bacteroidaceae bacterium]|nr:fimbrillin family protein [Bacteroidaceae bacterium]